MASIFGVVAFLVSVSCLVITGSEAELSRNRLVPSSESGNLKQIRGPEKDDTRKFHRTADDYYEFITNKRKRGPHHTADDYYAFLTDGQKRGLRRTADDYYAFLTDEQKRGLHRTADDYYAFLTEEQKRGSRRSAHDHAEFQMGNVKNPLNKKNHDVDGYWDFVGAKRTPTDSRKKRSIGEVATPNPSDDDVKSGVERSIEPEVKRSVKPEMESWDDFVVGRRSGNGREMSFEDFLVGRKRSNGQSDYDYSEFVLGKRP